MRYYFYYKDKKRVMPIQDSEKNILAKKKLNQILKKRKG